MSKLLLALKFLLFALSFAMAAYAIPYLSMNPDWGFLATKAAAIKTNTIWQLCFYLHLLAGTIAIAIGPFQFMDRCMNRFMRSHRILGKMYVGAILLGGLLALHTALYADGGIAGKAGFTGLALAWLLTTFIAYRKIKERNVVQHRYWMIRSYAVTLASVSFRIIVGVGIAAGLGFGMSYMLTTWLCWLVNLSIAELIIRQKQKATDKLKVAYS